MLDIDDTRYERSYFDGRFAEFRSLPHLSQTTGRRYAACFKDAATWLALCLFLRERGASIAPLHPNTPLEAAKRLAARMGCTDLLFQTVDQPVLIPHAAPGPGGVLVQLSSGTTGDPKCIERSWSAVATEVDSYSNALGDLEGHVPLVACPTSHSYGLISGVLSALHRGARPNVLTNLNPKYLIRRATATQNALLYGSPTLLSVVVRLLPEGARLCALMSSGSPLRTALLKELADRSRRVLQQYGCSEVGCISINREVRAAHELGTPLGHLTVAAGTSERQPDEIRVGTGTSLLGTKDLGYFGERGLCFVSRLDDTINVAGVNVYPREVEEVILEFPEIDDAVVYRRADPYASERVCLQFTARTEVDLGELRRFCVENLTPYAVPLDMQQVAEIPKLENGKVNRRNLELSSRMEEA